MSSRLAATRPWHIVGHAIVTADDRIAAADGSMPPALRNDADWVRFQAALDASDLVVTGREGHEAHPNKPHRRRLVLTSRAAGLERVRDAVGQVFLLNPARMLIEQALDALLPVGGRVAVTGGTRVFDAFLGVGYDVFDLVRATRARLPDGRPVFTACREGATADDVLRDAGLRPDAIEDLDRAAGVTLTVWRAPR